MSITPAALAPIKPAKTPKVGIVSLGCPKALVDSERIITRLRAEGYQIAPDYAGADLVLVKPAVSSTPRATRALPRLAKPSRRMAR